MKVRIKILVMLLMPVYVLSMFRPTGKKNQVISSSRGLPKLTTVKATQQLRAIINDSAEMQRLGLKATLTHIQNLVKEGADANLNDSDGLSLLRLVIKKIELAELSGHEQAAIIETLLDRGASLTGSPTATPMYDAIYYNLPTVVEVLLTHGAVVTPQDQALAAYGPARHEIKNLIAPFAFHSVKLP